jgi:type II secretory pathway pseudopilin PulG
VRNTFTVLELLLVIAIIAVMASIVAFSVRPAEVLQSANEVKNMQYAKQIENAISGYIYFNMVVLFPQDWLQAENIRFVKLVLPQGVIWI